MLLTDVVRYNTLTKMAIGFSWIHFSFDCVMVTVPHSISKVATLLNMYHF